jgi:hypothetical protein
MILFEDKIACKLGSVVTMADHRVLIRVVLTLQAIYHITFLELLLVVLKEINGVFGCLA